MKPSLEFFSADRVEWAPVSGVPGSEERVLSEDPETGLNSRLLRLAPGVVTSRTQGVVVHDHWEEILILEGEVTDLTLGETFTRGMYACRPPGMRHGPWESRTGCLLFEVRY